MTNTILAIAICFMGILLWKVQSILDNQVELNKTIKALNVKSN